MNEKSRIHHDVLMSLRSSPDRENGQMPLYRLIYSIRHSRAGGNPGLFSCELAWIPAFAGMTDRRGLPCCPEVPHKSFRRRHGSTMLTTGSEHEVRRYGHPNPSRSSW